MYTFDDQLTTDQKLTHIKEWIAASEAVVRDTAPGGPFAHEDRHSMEAERLRMLQTWQRLVEVEEELAASKADLDDPDPLGDQTQEAWCRMTRLMLKVAGVHVLLEEEKTKKHPSPERIERLRARRTALFKKLFIAQEEAESHAITEMAIGLAVVDCEEAGCTEAKPCPPCACRMALEGAES